MLGEICQKLGGVGEISKKINKNGRCSPQIKLQSCVMAQNDRIDEFFQKQ